METKMQYTIYTEDMNRDWILKIIGEFAPEGATILYGVSQWEKATEQSIIIILIGVSFAAVKGLATAIKVRNQQAVVLLTEQLVATLEV